MKDRLPNGDIVERSQDDIDAANAHALVLKQIDDKRSINTQRDNDQDNIAVYDGSVTFAFTERLAAKFTREVVLNRPFDWEDVDGKLIRLNPAKAKSILEDIGDIDGQLLIDARDAKGAL